MHEEYLIEYVKALYHIFLFFILVFYLLKTYIKNKNICINIAKNHQLLLIGIMLLTVSGAYRYLLLLLLSEGTFYIAFGRNNQITFNTYVLLINHIYEVIINTGILLVIIYLRKIIKNYTKTL
jgi:hypothetical protein